MPADESFRCPACKAKLKFGKRPKSRVTCPRCRHEFDYTPDPATRPSREADSEAAPLANPKEELGGTAAFALALQEAAQASPHADAEENLDPFDEDSADGEGELPPQQPALRRLGAKKKKAAAADKPDAFIASRKSAPRKFVSPRDNTLLLALVGVGALTMLCVIALVAALVYRNSQQSAKFVPPENYVAMKLGTIPLSGQKPEGWQSEYGGGFNGPPIFVKISDGGSISVEIRESLVLKLAQVAGGRRAAFSMDQIHEYYGVVTGKNFTNYGEDSARPIRTEGFGDAFVSDFRGSDGILGGKVKGCRASLAHAGRQYNVICKCSPAQFDDVKPVFEKIIASLGTGEKR
jgi:hypothetical protein